MKTLTTSSSSATQTTKSPFAQLRNGAVALAVSASLLVGSLGFATPADARVPRSQQNADDNARLCHQLQLIWDAAKESSDVITMRKVAADWSLYCRARFGSIAIREAPTAPDLFGQVQDMAPATDGGDQVFIDSSMISRNRLDVR